MEAVLTICSVSIRLIVIFGNILVLKALRRKYESLWRMTRLTVHFDVYSESCMDVKL